MVATDPIDPQNLNATRGIKLLAVNVAHIRDGAATNCRGTTSVGVSVIKLKDWITATLQAFGLVP